MKPCRKNRKLIAWLAINALDPKKERELRAHLETCPGCRLYLKEISGVAQHLQTAETRADIRAHESFHQNVLSSLRANPKARQAELAWLGRVLSWDLALPLIGGMTLVIVSLTSFINRPGPSRSVQTMPPAVSSTAKLDLDLQPTLSNYQMAANQSPDVLDELLTKQAQRVSSPAPIYVEKTFLLRTLFD